MHVHRRVVLDIVGIVDDFRSAARKIGHLYRRRNIMMKFFVCVVVGGALCIGSPALALPQEAFWVEVPVVDDAADASDLTGFRSFDLFVQLEDGDLVYAQDFKVAGPNTGLSLGPGQDFFQHPAGGDSGVDPTLIGSNGDLVYDTRGQMGTLAFGEFIELETATVDVDWDPAGVEGVWFPDIFQDPPFVEAFPDADNRYWFARITVNSAGAFGEQTSQLGEFLGGQLFVSGEGPNGDFGMQVPSTGVVDIPNAFEVPAPGAAVFGALGSCVLLRRRR